MFGLQCAKSSERPGKAFFTDSCRGSRIDLCANGEGDMTAPDASPKNLAQLSLEMTERAGELECGIEKPVIDATDFDSNPHVFGASLCRPKPRHAIYHVRWAMLRRPNDFVNSKTPSEYHRH